MGGIVGRLFREFAVTLAIAIALSALVSLTLTPMMSARLLSADKARDTAGSYRHVGALLRRDARASTTAASCGCSGTGASCSS